MLKQLIIAAALLAAGLSHANDLTHLLLKAGAALVDEGRPYKGHTGDRPQTIDPSQLRLPPAAAGFSQCRDQFPNGNPPSVPPAKGKGSRALCFNGFAVLYSPGTKTPIYAAEVLNRQRIQDAKGEQRTNQFFEDARLSAAERSLLDDYRGSGFDRGHMAPAGDMPNPEAMAQSFSLANIIPQSRENNQNAWADIEKATRKYVARAHGDVYVFTGPVFNAGTCPFVQTAERALQNRGLPVPSSPTQIVREAAERTSYKAPYRYDAEACTIGASRVKVPSHIYKLVYDAATGRSWAHWLENTDWAIVSRPISYERLVELTGIEFLPTTTTVGQR